MKLFSLVSFGLLLCCALPLHAEDKDADHADVRIDPLPAGWEGHPMDATFLATNDATGAMIQLTSSWHSANFEAYCKTMKEREDGACTLTDRKITDLHPATVGPPGTMEYDQTGKNTDTDSHIHIYFMPVRKTFCTLKCYCDAAAWDKSKHDFDEMAKNAK